MEIPIYYDPMIAKLITYGKDRTEAIERMVRAIDEYQITGITTTLGFGRFVMQDEAFIAAIVMEKLLSQKKIAFAGNPSDEISTWVKNRRD